MIGINDHLRALNLRKFEFLHTMLNWQLWGIKVRVRYFNSFSHFLKRFLCKVWLG